MDYKNKESEQIETVGKYASEIQQCQYVHSLSFRIKDVEIEIHATKAYRSVHYLIRDEKIYSCVEVQVRTLFEKAWGEIDHVQFKSGN